jgi:hypothetical protein
VSVYPLREDFAEGNGAQLGAASGEDAVGVGGGVTYSCAAASEIANPRADCRPKWRGGATGPESARILQGDATSGAVRWDVTADVRAGVRAWLIRKPRPTSRGRLVYHSREGALALGEPALAPRLVTEAVSGEQP